MKILLADDADDNVLLLRPWLQSIGYIVDLAVNGEVAVKKFASGAYNVVLMDMQMPVMDGFGASRSIRRWEKENGRSPVPIFALTGYSGPEEVQRSLDAGCTAHLVKPIDLTTLLAAIEGHTVVRIRADLSLRSLIPRYLQNRGSDIDAITTALEENDYETVRILGHNMKGTGTGYGFGRITAIGASLEQAALRRAPEEIRLKVAELVHFLGQLRVDYE